jgi:AraC-like DNA-binding protein
MNQSELSDARGSAMSNAAKNGNAAKKHILHRLLNNEFSSGQEALENLAEYDTGFSHPRFLAVVFCFDHYGELSGRLGPGELHLLKCGVLDTALDHFRPHFACEGLENGVDQIALLLNGDRFDEKALGTVEALCWKVIENADRHLKIKITAGIGTDTDPFPGAGASFRNARTAVQYRLVYGRQSVIRYRDIAGRERKNYPYELEQHLINSLKQNNPDHFVVLLQQFSDTIRNGSVSDIKYSLLSLCAALMKYALLHASDPDSSAVSFGDFCERLLSLDTLDQMTNSIAEYVSEQILFKNPVSQQKKEELLGSAIEYIHSHYSDPDLTVELIAQHINYSASHMRKLFKDVYNCSPTEYLFHYRLETAKRLLAETDETARAISEKVGYLNSKYFYNIFKKSADMTTYEYREQMRGKSNP